MLREPKLVAPKKNTVEGALQFCLRSLSAKDQGVSRIREKLQERGYLPEVIDKTVALCCDLGYLDDQRLASNVAERMLEGGKGAGNYLVQKLRKLGVETTEIRRALDEQGGQIDVVGAMVAQIGKKFPQFHPGCYDPKLLNRIQSYFMRRGYSYGQIREALRQYNVQPDLE